MLPAIIALIAENTGHVKAVGAMTKRDLDPMIGRAIFADGVGTAVATVGGWFTDDDLRGEHRRHGGDPDLFDRRLLRRGRVAILFGLCPKFGALSRRLRAGCSAGSPWCCTG